MEHLVGLCHQTSRERDLAIHCTSNLLPQVSVLLGPEAHTHTQGTINSELYLETTTVSQEY